MADFPRFICVTYLKRDKGKRVKNDFVACKLQINKKPLKTCKDLYDSVILANIWPWDHDTDAVMKFYKFNLSDFVILGPSSIRDSVAFQRVIPSYHSGRVSKHITDISVQMYLMFQDGVQH